MTVIDGRYQHRRDTGAGVTPANLLPGEIAVNLTDEDVFLGKADGSWKSLFSLSKFTAAVRTLIGGSLVEGDGVNLVYDTETGLTTVSATATGGVVNELTGLIVPIGDSRSAQNWSYTNTRPALLARSPIGWAEVLSRRLRVDERYRQGVSGNEVADVWNRIVANTPNDDGFGPNDVPLGTLWFLLIGTNDITGSASKAVIDTALGVHQQIVEWIVARGDTVIVATEWPRVAAGGTPLTTAEQKRMQYYAQKLKTRYIGWDRVYTTDVWKEVADPASTTGDPLAGVLNSDGLHNSPAIAYVQGKKIAEIAELIGMPVRYRPTASNSDIYDATDNPSGNIHPNPMLKGSDAASGSGATGVEPTSWNLDASTGLAVEGSRENVTLPDGRVVTDAYKLVISGTASTTGLYARLRISGLLSMIASGDVIEGGVEYLIDAGHVNLAAVGIVLDPGVTVDQVHGMVNLGGTNPDQVWPTSLTAEKIYGATRTPKYTVPGTLPGSFAWDIRVRNAVAGTFSCTVWLLSTSLRKV